MSGLMRNDPKTPEGKFLVLHRDGTKPDCDYFVLLAKDMSAPDTMQHYAWQSKINGVSAEYHRDLCALTQKWFDDQADGVVIESNPSSPSDRQDAGWVVGLMRGETPLTTDTEQYDPNSKIPEHRLVTVGWLLAQAAKTDFCSASEVVQATLISDIVGCAQTDVFIAIDAVRKRNNPSAAKAES